MIVFDWLFGGHSHKSVNNSNFTDTGYDHGCDCGVDNYYDHKPWQPDQYHDDYGYGSYDVYDSHESYSRDFDDVDICDDFDILDDDY